MAACSFCSSPEGAEISIKEQWTRVRIKARLTYAGAIVAMVAGLAVIFSAPASAAKTYRYNVQVTGYAQTTQTESTNTDPRLNGTGEVVMRWRGTWRDVRLRATFFNRRSFSVMTRRPARGRGRAQLQFDETRELFGGDQGTCQGTIKYPLLPTLLNVSALVPSPTIFNLSGQLPLAAGQRLDDITHSRYESACRHSDGGSRVPNPSLPFLLGDTRGANGLRVAVFTPLLGTDFQRRRGGPRAFPLRALRRGRKVSYSSGLLRSSGFCSSDQACQETRRYRLGFKLIPRRHSR